MLTPGHRRPGRGAAAALRRIAPGAALALLAACSATPPPGGDPSPAPPLIRAPQRETPVSPAADPLLAPLRQALAQGDWMAAQLALPARREDAAAPEAADSRSGSELDRWLRYYRARIALLRGDRAAHDEALAALAAQPLSAALRRELLAHRLRQAELAGDAAGAAHLAFELLQALPAEEPPAGAVDAASLPVSAALPAATPDGVGSATPAPATAAAAGGAAEAKATAAAEARLWRAAQALAQPAADAPWRSWWELSQAASRAGGADAASAIEDWLRRHPGHPAAARARRLQRAAQADAGLQRPALLLPQSGPLGDAGQAVSDGFLAAWYAAPGGVEGVELLDSGRFERVAEAAAAALQRGADRLVGPLGKRSVEALLAGDVQPPPLTLNRPQRALRGPPGSLQLSLAPEDEARQLAQRAFGTGARAALLIRPEGDWGERMERALLQPWRRLGGRLRARAVFGSSAASHSASIRDALDLDASAERSRELRRLFGNIESSGRRREDIDVVFLLCRNAAAARSLRPQINYHYAGDLPVFALSTLDDGAPAGANRDLEGIMLTALPWRFAGTPPGLGAGSAADAFSALHALGADAWALAQRQRRLAAGAGLRYRGHTALFSVADDGTLLRELPMAAFDRGVLRPR